MWYKVNKWSGLVVGFFFRLPSHQERYGTIQYWDRRRKWIYLRHNFLTVLLRQNKRRFMFVWICFYKPVRKNEIETFSGVRFFIQLNLEMIVNHNFWKPTHEWSLTKLNFYDPNTCFLNTWDRFKYMAKAYDSNKNKALIEGNWRSGRAGYENHIDTIRPWTSVYNNNIMSNNKTKSNFSKFF